MFEVIILDNTSNDVVIKELVEKGNIGHIGYKFTAPNTGSYRLSFTVYEKAQGKFTLDNIEILDVTGLDVAQVLQNSQEMPIFVPSVLSFSDYYPFGMRVPNRHKSSNNSSYRYGYQGSEKDDEVKGEANSYTTRFRQLDVRLGRWLSIDPKATAFETPYSSMSNNPIMYTDKLGDSILVKGKDGNRYRYINGKFYNGKKEYKLGTDTFVDKTLKSIQDISKSGSEGNRLVNKLANDDKHWLRIRYKEGVQGHNAGSILFDFNLETKVMDEKGFNLMPNWLIMAHEMAHAEDGFRGTLNNDVWGKVGDKEATESEKYATHIENKIRAQSNLPLRTHYGIIKYTDKSVKPVLKIIDSNGSSLFYSETLIHFRKITEVPNTPLIIEVRTVRYNYRSHKK